MLKAILIVMYIHVPFLSVLLGINEYVLSFVKPGSEREREEREGGGKRERRRERGRGERGRRERGERRERRRERGRGEEREEEREEERGGERARQLFIALSKKITNPHHTQIPHYSTTHHLFS